MTDYAAEIKQKLTIDQVVRRCGFEPNAGGFIQSIYTHEQQRTGSLRIYPDSNSFFCFAFNKGGDLFDFWMAFYNVDFQTAIKELCEVAGVTYRPSGGGASPRRKGAAVSARCDEILNKNIIACLSKEEKNFYNEDIWRNIDVAPEFPVAINSNLYKKVKQVEARTCNKLRISRIHKDNMVVLSEIIDYCRAKGKDERALKYLTEIRKLPAGLIDKFMITCIGNYNELNNHLKKTFSLDKLKRVGTHNDKGNLIFYNHRILIPYLWGGWPVYLRGRHFDEAGNTRSEQAPKYIGLRSDALGVNTPKRFYNSDILIKLLEGEKLYIVEGEFDAVALSSLGYNVIAVPGVGNIPAKNKLSALVDYQIVICTDTDEAGKGLQKTLIGLFHELKKEVYIKELKNKDINELIAEPDKTG